MPQCYINSFCKGRDDQNPVSSGMQHPGHICSDLSLPVFLWSGEIWMSRGRFVPGSRGCKKNLQVCTVMVENEVDERF